MFSRFLEWVRNWVFRRVLNNHRLLFRYWDGRKYVAADPFVLLRRMLSTQKFDPESDLKKLNISDSKIITERIGFIAEGVREIFDLSPFRPDGRGGLTELECVNLLMEFTGYLERVKKNGGSNLMSVPSTVPASATMESGELGPNDTNENSGSGSTQIESASSTVLESQSASGQS
jgi:hypothetical protein